MTAPDMTPLVAPLVWHWPRTVAATYLAETSIGEYSIVDLGGNWTTDRYVLRFDGCRVSHHPSVEAAKAAAQADYTARIAAALDPAALGAMLADAEQRGREEERAIWTDAIETYFDATAVMDIETHVAAIHARGVK